MVISATAGILKGLGSDSIAKLDHLGVGLRFPNL